MGADALLFLLTYMKVPCCIFCCNEGVVISVKMVSVTMPVVQIIVVEKGCPHQNLFVGFQVKKREMARLMAATLFTCWYEVTFPC